MVLLVTVGGNHQPIVRAIETIRPEFVVFLCSHDLGTTKGSYEQVVGKGNVLRSSPGKAPDLPNIVVLTELPEGHYKVVTMPPDDFERCYAAIRKEVAFVKKEYPRGRICADYTGGTKTMSAALVTVAVDDPEIQLLVTVGDRRDLEKVADRTEHTTAAPTARVRTQRILDSVDQRLTVYDYDGAEAILREAVAGLQTDNAQRVRGAIHFCQGLKEWDKFQYARAYDSLKPYGRYLKQIAVLGYLQSEQGSRSYTAVEDLLHNAERRYCQERYDDAGARVYRSLELLVQVWLQERYGIHTSDVDVSKVPSEARPFVEAHREAREDTVKLGLMAAWDLLQFFPNDALGRWYEGRRNVFLDFLQHRNLSKLAHGDRPVDKMTYLRSARPVIEMCREVLGKIPSWTGKRVGRLEQLPNRLPDELKQLW
ncbi:MAG TPA: TIGR02710 family CRISPR-associated protein [Alicyclobacillus sp.]|nr:TIGR02710 family CRISPR-associated protein [Alicyclobacillus sp.]